MVYRPSGIRVTGGGVMGKRLYQDIEIRGTVYPDVGAAAKALGVRPDAVRLAVRKGTAHRIGTRATGVEPMPVRIRGQVYPSAKVAAQALGVRVSAIYMAMAKGREDALGLPRRYNGAKSKEFSIGGLSFPSQNAASRALGFRNPEYVTRVLQRQSASGFERILGAAMAYAAKNPDCARQRGRG